MVFNNTKTHDASKGRTSVCHFYDKTSTSVDENVNVKSFCAGELTQIGEFFKGLDTVHHNKLNLCSQNNWYCPRIGLSGSLGAAVILRDGQNTLEHICPLQTR